MVWTEEMNQDETYFAMYSVIYNESVISCTALTPHLALSRHHCTSSTWKASLQQPLNMRDCFIETCISMRLSFRMCRPDWTGIWLCYQTGMCYQTGIWLCWLSNLRTHT